MRVNTLKTIPALNHTGVDHVSWLHEELAKLRYELDRQSKEMDLRVETKMTELMENMNHKIKTLLLTNPEEEAHESFVGARHTRGYQKVLSLTWKEPEIWIYSALFFNVVPFQLHTLVPSSFPVINTRSVEVNILVP